tara:strand:- start:14402 stop:15496 length:1095 start_codon:yes stop_codon:yes gene_type:complete
MFIDNSYIMGTLNIVLRDGDGRVKQHKTVRNKVMNQGLAHIVGRMMDQTEATASEISAGTAYNYGHGGVAPGVATTDVVAAGAGFTGAGRAEAGRKHFMPKMMRYMGLGIGQAQGGSGNDATPNQSGNSNVFLGEEWALEREVTIGVQPQFQKAAGTDAHLPVQQSTFANGSDGDNTNNGRVDMSPLAAAYATPGNLTEIYQGDVTGTLLAKDAVNTTSGATTYVDAEGTYLDAGTDTSTPNTTPLTTQRTTMGDTNLQDSEMYYKNYYKDKKVGKRLVFVAVFPPNAPSNASELKIVEAGVFNGQSPFTTLTNTGTALDIYKTSTLREQTMLCRTTFSVVTKTVNDTLQITWSIQFQDATTGT